jgi:hypothetical protein
VSFTGCAQNAKPKVHIEEKPFVVEPQQVMYRNPNGASFEAERLSDTVVPKIGSVASYKFIARNFKPNDTMTLMCQNLGGIPKPVAAYQVDDDGTLGRQVPEGTMIFDNDVWLMFDFFRGEPVRYWLVSKDRKTILSTDFVPYPILAKGYGGAQISLRRLVADARLVICEGEGFLPDEELIVTSKSSDRMIANVPVVCAYGKFSMLFEPAQNNKTGGTGFIEFKRQNERLVLEYDWGSEAVSTKKRIANSISLDPGTLQKLSDESQ